MKCPHCHKSIEGSGYWEFFNCPHCEASLQSEEGEVKLLQVPEAPPAQESVSEKTSQDSPPEFAQKTDEEEECFEKPQQHGAEKTASSQIEHPAASVEEDTPQSQSSDFHDPSADSQAVLNSPSETSSQNLNEDSINAGSSLESEAPESSEYTEDPPGEYPQESEQEPQDFVQESESAGIKSSSGPAEASSGSVLDFPHQNQPAQDPAAAGSSHSPQGEASSPEESEEQLFSQESSDLKESSELSSLTEFGNKDLQSHSYTYHLVISEIHSSYLLSQVKSVLQLKLLHLNAAQALSSLKNGRIQISQLSSVQTFYLVKFLSDFPLTLRWTQKL